MQRLRQITLIFCLLATSWLGMQAVHEFGHVLGAWYTGASVNKVVLRPWTISRTDLGINPTPLVVTWAGPVLGAVLPFSLWCAAWLAHCPGAYLLRFFAGFCLVANGAYIGGGAFYDAGDAGALLDYGAPLWQLIAFAAVTVPLGLWLWHKEGRHFGFGKADAYVSSGAVVASVIALIGVLVIEFVLGSP